MEELKVKYFTDQIDELCYVAGKSDWIDIHAAEEVTMKAGEFRLIPLGIAVALAGDPDFLILDEPANGLDPQGIIETRELILKLNRERQITVLISSHILDELSKLATHYGFIYSGRIVKELSARELEAACRKCLRIEVTDTRALARVLDGMGVKYKILDDGKADVFAMVNISKLSKALDNQGCELLSVQERDESLESYFVNLVGGGFHD